MCQPGRPRPQGESQPGCSSVEGFQRMKSPGWRLLLRFNVSEADFQTQGERKAFRYVMDYAVWANEKKACNVWNAEIR